MIGNTAYPGYQMQPTYPAQAYRPIYQPPQPMQMNQPQMEPGMVNARYVTCKEEVVAAQIIPDGNPYFFVCEAQGRIFCKRYTQAGPEFVEYARVQPQQNPPEQYAPMDALKALGARVEQLEQILTAPQGAHREGSAE